MKRAAIAGLLLVAGVLQAPEALAGFGNPAPMTVAALYVVAAGVERTGLAARLVESLARHVPKQPVSQDLTIDLRAEERALDPQRTHS